MEAGDASLGNRKRPRLNLPPGYHFAPTDEELIVYYLRRQIAELTPLVRIFIDTNVVGGCPEKITEEFKDYGEDDRWYFFTRRDRKYKSGSRPNRTTPDKGYWKATGPQRKIYTGKKEKRLVGRVRTLVFYNPPTETDQVPSPKGTGKADKKSEGKTSWTMYEYENLTSEAEAADHNVDKIDEWVLCTIQKQKKDESKEGSRTKGKRKIREGSSCAGEYKAKETKGKGKKISKKRKGEQEKMEAEKGTEQEPIQALHIMKRSRLPMHFPEMERDEMGMFDSEYNSSPVPRVQQHESPRSQTMSPCITDNNYYGSNMAPTPCLQEPPHSETTSTSVGGNYYSIASAGSDMMPSMPWRGQQPLLEMIPPAFLTGNSHGFGPQEAPYMKMEYQTPSPLLGYNNYRNIDSRMATHQPAASYSYPPLAFGYGYGGAAQNAGSHYGYPELGSFFSSSSSGFNFGESSQYHGGSSAPGTGIAVTPAAPLQWRDQATART